MSKSRAQLKEFGSLPIAWLSDGRLRTSILLRQEAARKGRSQEALRYLLHERFSPHVVVSHFPKLSEPDSEMLTRASDDYLRCVLAKSISEVYRKITPKYRNEAARKQFFKRLFEIAEALHLSESTQRLREVIAPSQMDDAMMWVHSEFERLAGEKVDLASEYSSRLTSARVEFKSIMRQLENLIGINWQQSERYRGTLIINSFFPPSLTESEETWRWGAQWYPEEGILNLNPPLLFFDIFRRGVLAREAAILLSPLNLENMPDAPRVLCEQAEYLAYRLFERKNDRELWSESRHGLRQKTRFRGHELVEFFEFYEMMVGDSIYKEIWSRLKEFGTARLTITDYYVMLNTLASRPTNPKFDETELRLLDLLSKRPDVRPGEAARLIGVSIPTAMKAIRDLSRKAGLRFTIIADMKRLGLVENLVLLNTSKQAEVLRVLTRFPFCRQVFRAYGTFDLLSVFDIPAERTEFTQDFLHRMVARDLVRNYKMLNLNRDLQAVNFDHYDPVQKRWDIHWDTWGVTLREDLSAGESVNLDYPGESERFRFDRLDLNILSNLQVDCRTPFSTMARSLGVSGAYIGKKVARMMREHLLRYALWPLKIGAEDWGVVGLSCSKETASVLARHVSELPAWRGGIVSGDFNGILAIVWAPNGELKQLFKAIDDRVVRTGFAHVECLNAVGEWVLARWLPVEPEPWQLCTEDGKWLFDEQRYHSLLS